LQDFSTGFAPDGVAAIADASGSVSGRDCIIERPPMGSDWSQSYASIRCKQPFAQ